uniref:Uncharacterized protein n=1 Tax=Romanomermis culicivorax TaxID=13658 RepID=A0A915JWC7_ROMCU
MNAIIDYPKFLEGIENRIFNHPTNPLGTPSMLSSCKLQPSNEAKYITPLIGRLKNSNRCQHALSIHARGGVHSNNLSRRFLET